MKFLKILFLLLIPAMLYANGGPVDETNTVSTGNIVLKENTSVTLEKEDLSIVMDGDYADVTVTYILDNRGEKVSLLYGFPVDYYTETELKGKSRKDAIKTFLIRFNGNEIPSVKADKKDTNDREDGSGRTVGHRWYTSELEFAPGKSTLEVSYRIRNTLTDNEFSSSCYTSWSKRDFTYILAPSGKWGNGKAGEFNVTVDFSKMTAYPNKQISIRGLDLKKDGETYKGSFSDFKLADKEPLVVSYSIEDGMILKLMTKNKSSLEYVDEIKSSSSLKGPYGPEKMFDGNLKTAWSEGKEGDGKGEYVQFNINGNIAAMGIANGMCATKELYYQNNRIKKLRLIIITTDPGDKPLTKDIELPDVPYPENGIPLNTLYTIIFKPDESVGAIRQIAVMVYDVYPGTKYKDTCISEIYFWKCNYPD